MAASVAAATAPRLPFVAGRIWGFAGCLGLTLLAAAALVAFGTMAFTAIVFVALALAALVLPRGFSFALLALGVAIEPNAADFTGPLSTALYELPAPLAKASPFTVSPIERS